MNKAGKAPKEDHTPTVNFHVDKESKQKLDLSGIELNDMVVATVKGKVISLSQNNWGDGLEIKVSSIKLDKEGQTLIEALKKIKKG